jgi:hypothetical protein
MCSFLLNLFKKRAGLWNNKKIMMMRELGIMLNKKIGISLLFLFAFLTWLFFSIYFSDEKDWWTVIKVEQTSYDTFVGTVSPIRVFIGAIIFSVLGLIVYKIYNKK